MESSPDDAAADGPPLADAAAVLLNLARLARRAASLPELGFLAVNDSHALGAYRQAALWLGDAASVVLSGVVQPEANAPYVQWLDKACRALAAGQVAAGPVDASALPPAIAAEWHEWLPAHGLWLPLQAQDESAATPASAEAPTAAAPPIGGLLLARETPWPPERVALLAEWFDIWRHAWCALQARGRWPWQRWLGQARPSSRPRRLPLVRLAWVSALVGVCFLPVRLTVLVPGELVPAHPALIRAPQEGVVGNFFVKPNEMVEAGQPLFDLDSTTLTSKLEVAQQALASAEAEYRQSAQLAVSDGKYKSQIALLTGKVEERRAEVDYLRGQLERAHVVAPQAGMVLFDDPSEWVGKPVATGERIMRVATPEDVEIEGWLPVGDAIPIRNGAAVTLYLNATPLSPVAAQISYLAHDALQRPDGSYAYRMRATLKAGTAHRIGLKGTAKLAGERAPLCYWVLRKPLAAMRQFIGY